MRTQARSKIFDIVKRPRASPPAALPWSLQVTSRALSGYAAQCETKTSCSERSTTCGGRYNAICTSRRKLPDKCLRLIMGQTGSSTSNFQKNKKQSESEPLPPPHTRPIRSQMLQSFCQGCRGQPTLGLASFTSTETSSLNPSTVLRRR